MRPLTFVAAALALLPGAFAVEQTKSAIIWFEDSVADSIVSQAKDTIIKAGGKITHTYSIIKGFAAIAPETALNTVTTWGEPHDIHVEWDEVVSIS